MLTIVKEKRYRKMKGNGRKQRNYISNKEAVSLTVQLEILVMSRMIDSREGRYVTTVDVVGI